MRAMSSNQHPSGSSAARCIRYLQHHPWQAALLLGLCALFCGMWGIADGPLAKTEGVRALTGHQILVNGDWLIPRLFGSVYLRKPPMFYWIIAVTEKITGSPEPWAWRLPSVISYTLLCLWTFFLARRWLGAAAGLAAGFGLLLLIPIWGESRSAEIDTFNNLASFVAAGCLLELGYGRGRKKLLWAALLGLGFGCALLAKGPAGIFVLIGVLIGAPLATRRARWLLSPWVWGGLLSGIALFAWWALAAKAGLEAIGHAQDMSGVREVSEKINPLRQLKNLPLVLTLPLVLLLYALPLSTALPAVRGKRFRKTLPDDIGLWTAALTGSLAGALIFGVVAQISNPRYMYMVLPLFALLTGAAARMWSDGLLPPRRTAWIRGGLAFFALVACIAQPVLLYRSLPQEGFLLGLSILCIPATWGLALYTLKQWRAERPDAACLGTLGLSLLLTINFNAFTNQDRAERSGRVTAEAMKEHVPEGTLIHAERMVYFHPEIFYYADYPVQRYPENFDGAFTPPFKEGWMLMGPKEWRLWGEQNRHRLESYTRLPGPDSFHLGYYRAP